MGMGGCWGFGEKCYNEFMIAPKETAEARTEELAEKPEIYEPEGKMDREQAASPETDTRNLRDHLKGLSNEEVRTRLGEARNGLEVAIENLEHDFNVGTIVRSANNFNVAKVHIIGRHKYNRRGAMCTDKYLEVEYWPDVQGWAEDQKRRGQEIVAIENNTDRVKPLVSKKFVQQTTLLFGSEGEGLSGEALALADDVREIESFGSTRSVNVGVAAGIAMYEWARQCVLEGGAK